MGVERYESILVVGLASAGPHAITLQAQFASRGAQFMTPTELKKKGLPNNVGVVICFQLSNEDKQIVKRISSRKPDLPILHLIRISEIHEFLNKRLLSQSGDTWLMTLANRFIPPQGANMDVRKIVKNVLRTAHKEKHPQVNEHILERYLHEVRRKRQTAAAAEKVDSLRGAPEMYQVSERKPVVMMPSNDVQVSSSAAVESLRSEPIGGIPAQEQATSPVSKSDKPQKYPPHGTYMWFVYENLDKASTLPIPIQVKAIMELAERTGNFKTVNEKSTTVYVGLARRHFGLTKPRGRFKSVVKQVVAHDQLATALIAGSTAVPISDPVIVTSAESERVPVAPSDVRYPTKVDSPGQLMWRDFLRGIIPEGVDWTPESFIPSAINQLSFAGFVPSRANVFTFLRSYKSRSISSQTPAVAISTLSIMSERELVTPPLVPVVEAPAAEIAETREVLVPTLVESASKVVGMATRLHETHPEMPTQTQDMGLQFDKLHDADKWRMMIGAAEFLIDLFSRNLRKPNSGSKVG